MMKICLLLIVCLLHVQLALAGEVDNENVLRVTLRMKQQPMKKVLAEIERQTGMTFSYESSLLTGLSPVTFSVENEPLTSCLRKLFLGTGLDWQISGQYVILKKKFRMVTISGFVRDSASFESLIGTSVVDVVTRQGTVSNNSGFYSLTLPVGMISLQVSYTGYMRKNIEIGSLSKDTVINILMNTGNQLGEVVVMGNDAVMQPVRNTQMGALEISQQTIRNIPTLFGEADIIKTLQMTPGVAAGTEGFAGMYVRGGNEDQNLFLIDGNPVYQVNHVGGLFSAFNPEAIKSMEFFKAGFPARYGGRLSSVVDVHTKDGNMKEFHGSAMLGLISGNLTLEGPIWKDHTSFNIALRRTWLDVLTAPAIAIVNKKQKKDGYKMRARYAFHDLNLKINHRFNDRSRMYVSLYNGNDVLRGGGEDFSTPFYQTPFSDDTDSKLSWGNLVASAGWTYVFNNRLFGKIAGVYTQYKSNMKTVNKYFVGNKGDADYMESYNETSNQTGIMDIGYRALFDYMPSTTHRLRFGSDYMLHRFRPEYSKTFASDIDPSDTTQVGRVYSDSRLWANEFSLYAEDDWDILPALRLNLGLRFGWFNIERKNYLALEPRFSLRWLIDNNLSFKASYARMNQYVHLISNSYMSLPTDSWMPVTSRLKPLLSDQVSAGFYYNLNRTFDFSIEGYYKHMNNLLDYKDGYTFLPTYAQWEDKMAVGKGRSYGVKFMVRKSVGNTTGWVGYTLSWADRQFDDINEGRRFPSKYDNRHKLNIVVTHKLSPKVELTGAWTYASGNRATLSLENYENMAGAGSSNNGAYYPDGESLDFFTERNNFQLPNYHRLDLGINIYRPKKKGRMGIWNVSIYNVYCRMNPFMIYKSSKEVPVPGQYDGYGRPVTRNVPCFKTIGIMPIIPSISYTYKF